MSTTVEVQLSVTVIEDEFVLYGFTEKLTYLDVTDAFVGDNNVASPVNTLFHVFTTTPVSIGSTVGVQLEKSVPITRAYAALLIVCFVEELRFAVFHNSCNSCEDNHHSGRVSIQFIASVYKSGFIFINNRI